MAQYAATGDTMFQGYLEPELATDYFAEVDKASLITRIGRKVPMGTTGQRIPHWTGDVTAEWTAEAGVKPITKGDLTSQTLVPHKIASIFVATAEVVRANPAGYLDTMRSKIGNAIAMKLDRAVLDQATSPFGATVSDTTKAINIAGAGTATYDAFVSALELLYADTDVDGNKFRWNGTLLDDLAEPILARAKDTNGRPIFLEANAVPNSAVQPIREGSILGRPTMISDHVQDPAEDQVIGYLGDFSQIIWGQVGGLSWDVTDQATLNIDGQLVSLWQRNLVAVRVEAEYAALVNQPDAFVKLTNGVLTP